MGISRRKRLGKYLGLLLAMLLLGLGLLNYLAPLVDISPYQKDLTALISQTVQRRFELDEKLYIKLSLKPTIVMGKLSISNPDWCKSPYLLHAEQAELGVDLLDLALGKITINRLILKQASLNLEQDASRNNWSFGKTDKTDADKPPQGSSPVRLDFAVMEEVTIDYLSPKLHKQLHIKRAALKKSLRRRYKFDIEGELNKQKLHVVLNSNRWFDVQDIRPLTLRLDVGLAKNNLQADINIQQIIPRLQADVKLQSNHLDFNQLLAMLPGDKAGQASTQPNAIDPWLQQIDNIALDLNVGRLLYGSYEIKDLSTQNRIMQGVFDKSARFSVKASGKAGNIINLKADKPGSATTGGKPGQAGFLVASQGNTLDELVNGASIELQATNLSGNLYKDYLVKQIKLTTDTARALHVDGTMLFNKSPLAFNLKTGQAFIESLLQHESAQVDAALDIGKSKVTVNTAARDLFKPGQRKLQMTVAGDNMVAWEPVLDRAMYKLKHYRIEADMELQAKGIKVNRFTARTPDSDLKGKLFYRYGKRVTVNAQLENSRLRWADLNKQAEAPAPVQPVTKKKNKNKEIVMVIPKTDLLDILSPAFDVNLVMKSSDVVFNKFSLKGLDLKARWQDKVLATTIDKGRMATGALTADVYLTVVDNEAAGKVEVHIKQMDYGQLMQDMGLGDKMKGKADVSMHVIGFGKDFRTFLAHSDGTVEFVGEKGILASKYLRLWGEDIVQQILPTNWFGKEQTNLNCVVGRFDMTDGRLSSDSLLIDTEEITIAGTGAISLTTEEMDFVLMPDPKNISLISLATPVKIRGTLGRPHVEPHNLGTTWTIGSLLVGLANPALLIARFAKLGSLGENPCLAAIGKKEGEEEETSLLKAFKDTVKFIQRPLDKLPDLEK